MAKANENLAVWAAVEKTDPAYTKEFKKGGGFSGTAINPTYQIRRATEMFGPIGIGWGFTEIEHVIAGSDETKVWASKVLLWYMRDGARGEVIQWGGTEFIGKNKNGTFVDDEAPKKSITDALMKCLVLLGFSADVHLGLYDNSKYVNDRRSESHGKNTVDVESTPAGASTKKKESSPPEIKQTREQLEARCEKCLNIAKDSDLAQLNGLASGVDAVFGTQPDLRTRAILGINWFKTGFADSPFGAAASLIATAYSKPEIEWLTKYVDESPFSKEQKQDLYRALRNQTLKIEEPQEKATAAA